MKASREAGAGLIMTAWVILLMVIVAGAGLVATGYVVAQHRARAAADMAALAGAETALRAGVTEPIACAAAAAIAPDQGGRLDDCRAVGFNGLAAVTVTVAVPVGWVVAGLPSEIRATAAAGNVDA
jgi:secretion/DNA translocation related TadE-like protein